MKIKILGLRGPGERCELPGDAFAAATELRRRDQGATGRQTGGAAGEDGGRNHHDPTETDIET